MPYDTVKVAIIREPFSTFQSAFNYVDFDHVKALNIEGPNPMKTYLESPTLKEKTIHGKHFQNFISTEFGFSNHSVNDPTVVEEFIAYIDKHFRLVTITEYFKESLVLLKRMLCWKTEDIVFLHLNKNLDKTHQVKPESGRNFTYLKTLHKRWSRADYIFYDNFNQTFWRKIGREGKQFHDELRDFELILSKVTKFCRDGAKAVPPGDRLMVSKTRWHSAFYVTMLQCDQMQADIYTNMKLYFDRDW
ncbi:galactose-3-O-sulfotransferase 3-like [Lineus longissimus]|uniref:galactose-3-O-sulfotransferase 3-like n=1 Tax=Lineus longissimus TaxID=88925 RepID=UPI00315D507F